jgi:hypothetical protein
MNKLALCLALATLVGCVHNTRSQYGDNMRSHTVIRSTGPINDTLEVSDSTLPVYNACLQRLGDTPDAPTLCRKEVCQRQHIYVITRDGTIPPPPC